MALDMRFALLLWLAQKTGRSFDPGMSVAALRAAYADANARFGLRDPGGIDTRELTFAANDGASVAARLYRRSADRGRTLPVLLYFHGGGWVIGDLDAYDGLMRYIAHTGRFAVLAVDYRLGPEHRFPRAHEDALDAYAWLRANALELGVVRERIAVGGDSAGGALAAIIAADAGERDLDRPAFAWFIYPAVDGTRRFASNSRYTGNLPLTPTSMDWFMAHALRDPGDRSTPLFVPLDAAHPERHPPAYILAAQFDPLVDEGRAYAERLRAAGVPTIYDLRPTLPHGFICFARIIPEAKRALDAGIAATAQALGVRPRRVAAITGAASGIGRALAAELARGGYALALADRDAAGLAQTAQLAGDRAAITLHVLDVADKTAVDAFAADVLTKHGQIDVVVNNAGVALAGSVAELSVEEIAWLMNINFWGTVYGVKAFLPALVHAPRATIVNISSVYGIIAPPFNAAYAASKFAVRGFSESLREEMRGRVHVLTVHPGGIKTNIARSARIAAAADAAEQRRRAAVFERKMLTLTPEIAARQIARGIEQRRDRVLIGRDALQIDVLARLLGPRAARVIGRMVVRAADSAKSDRATSADSAAAASIGATASP